MSTDMENPAADVHRGWTKLQPLRPDHVLKRTVILVCAAIVWLLLLLLTGAGFTQHACMVICLSCILMAHSLSASADEDGRNRRLINILTAPALKVLSVTSLVSLDVMFYSFPLPFFPDLLGSFGKTNSQIACLASTYSYSALFTGIVLLVFQGYQKHQLADRDCWRVLAIAAAFMTLISFLQATYPTYAIILTTRCLQGAVSQFCWTYALALGMRLPPLFRASCVAWISSGESIGELAGPWFGSVLYQLGGVHCPFTAAAIIMFLNASLLGSMALCRHAWESPSSSAINKSCTDAEPQSLSMGFAVLRIPRVARLCMLLILACAMSRGALDAFTPMHMSEVFGSSPSDIGQVFGFGTLCYLFGSVIGGRILPKTVSLHLRLWVMLAAHICMSVAMIFVFRTTGACMLATYFAMFLGSSALLNVSVNTQLEEIGAQHGGTDSLAALSVLSWSVGFALGGVVTQVAAQDAGARAVALTCIGVANLVWLTWSAFLDRQLLCRRTSQCWSTTPELLAA
jgi:predicted MFS family arabinose efflux permease